MKYYKILCLSIYVLFILACAKQSTPTGGPKDSIPPVLVKSYPKQKQLNFKDNKVTLQFNESIQILNPKEQLIITPTVGKEYKASANKKEVTLEFEDKFQDSTTYTINFRESVSDITEKNAVKNLQLAFSTGTYIDSLVIEGVIFDLLKNKEAKEATIALYQADTFNIFKHKPTYITKSNENGIFKFENLKPENYHIYAFEDKNKNLIADSKSESYGFIAAEIILRNNIKGISIPLVHLDARPLKLTSARPYNNYFNIRFAKSVIRYTVTSDSTPITSCYAEDNANIKVFNNIGSLDSLKIKVHAEDSIGNSIDSSLYLKFNTKKVDLEKFSMTIPENTLTTNDGKLQIKFAFTKPITDINFDSLVYVRDSTQIFRFTKEEVQWEPTHNILTLIKTIDKKLFVKPLDIEKPKEIPKPMQKPISNDTAIFKTTKPTPSPNNLKDKLISPPPKPKKIIENQLQLGKGAFVSIDKDSTQARQEQVKPLREEDTGVILYTIKTSEKNFMVELLSKDYKTLETIIGKKDSKFIDLPPNSYHLKLVIDKNKNSSWDPGNFFKKEEPEPISFYQNEKKDPIVNLKANWELGPLLIKY